MAFYRNAMVSILIVLCFTTIFRSVRAVSVGAFDDGGNTLVSAVSMFLGSEKSVYMLDKYEQNAARVNGHPAWGSLWDVETRKAVVMDVRTSSYCASGMHLPNGTFVTLGGDAAGLQNDSYILHDGGLGIRIVNPCTISDNLNAGKCKWFEDPTQLAMKRQRWYATAEPTGEGRVVVIGGMVKGGYINRMVPNTDPATEGGSAEPTYEYFPPMDEVPQTLQFMIKTSGLNAFTYAFLMPSGKMLLQANHSTTLWDHMANKESALPDMPNGIIRVYPASGATAMLPLTPANNWTPTILFCGGTIIADQDWGSYDGPASDVWNVLASKDCQRLTPEPTDGSLARYEQDDDMLEPRTMGQFIILPTGQLLLLNGGQKGTGGYTRTGTTPFGTSFAAEPVLRPVIYDPNAAKGYRWSNADLGPSKIARLYHSTAILLPDGSVLAAGSNPNPDVNLTALFPTQYHADIFYPPYFSAKVRPSPQNLPKALSYGGPRFDILIPASSYSGNGNDAADRTIVSLVRTGFSTHAMNMGQRFIQLNNTYTVHHNGSITLHVSQLPPNPNLFQPGPALLYVCINGIPSIGKIVIAGNSNVGPQPTFPVSPLPANALGDGVGSANDSNPLNITIIAAVSASAAALILLILVAAFVYVRRKRAQLQPLADYPAHTRSRTTITGLSAEEVDHLVHPGHHRRPLIDPLSTSAISGGVSYSTIESPNRQSSNLSARSNNNISRSSKKGDTSSTNYTLSHYSTMSAAGNFDAAQLYGGDGAGGSGGGGVTQLGVLKEAESHEDAVAEATDTTTNRREGVLLQLEPLPSYAMAVSNSTAQTE